MPPVGVGASRFASALETGTAKLWVLLIGVNQYQDPTFPALKYAAIDCQGIGIALAAATDPFPHKEFLIHNDLVEQTPSLARVEFSLRRLVAEAQVQDTILIYFSGHGVVEPIEQQTVLCLSDTDRQHLLNTGLPIQVVLELLRHCAAHSQLLWLDACHSGNMRSLEQSPKSRAGLEIDRHLRSTESGRIQLNPSTQLLASLRQAVSNRGFYALLSCDEGQQSWEFPDLGHGVFSYYLMQGLNGAAADDQGIIDADSLYRYVYRQTMQYIDRTNQQVRLVNQVKRERGELSRAPEYSHQTPKRIVSGVGEIILGVVSVTTAVTPDRSALIIDGGAEDLSSELDTLSHVLTQEGKFTLDRFTPPSDTAASSSASVEDRIQTFLGETDTNQQDRSAQPISTRLLYLRGQIADVLVDRQQSQSIGADAWLILSNGAKLSRTWLGQKLRQSSHNQQIVMIDAPGANFTVEWVDALKLLSGNLCVIACAAPIEDAELFIQVLIEALISAAPQIGVPVVSLFTRLQTTLDALGVPCYLFLSGTQELIEIVPATELEPVELVELPQSPVVALDLPSPSANLQFETAPDLTFGQDHTYLQSPPQNTTTVTDSIETSLVSILAKLVGPIAPTLIARAQGENSTATIENLKMILPDRFKAIFSQQVQLLFVQPVIPPPSKVEQPSIKPSVADRSFHVASGRGVAIQQPVAVDESLLRTYEQELNLAIGPISQYIMTRTRKAHPQLSAPELIAALASNITDADQADLFRRKCSGKS
ncbi:MAG: caspase family protein [Chamaesiphon sp.]|nr:caspase family protein [Chamaesiphon sp.]